MNTSISLFLNMILNNFISCVLLLTLSLPLFCIFSLLFHNMLSENVHFHLRLKITFIKLNEDSQQLQRDTR